MGLLIPIIVFVLFWWSIAVLNVFKILNISESVITVVAISGLCIGILLDIIFLKKWIPKFYEMDKSLSISIYLFCSFIAVGFFMGLPIGNIVLGIFAGIYVGRKSHYLHKNKNHFLSTSKKVSLFTASITSLEALPIGLLALQDDSIIDLINQSIGIKLFTINIIIDMLLILMLCLMLFLLQYILTKKATIKSYQI